MWCFNLLKTVLLSIFSHKIHLEKLDISTPFLLLFRLTLWSNPEFSTSVVSPFLISLLLQKCQETAATFGVS